MKAFHAKIWQFAELKNPINVNSPFLPLGALQWYQKTSDCYHTRGKASNKVFDLVNILGSSPFPIIGTLNPFESPLLIGIPIYPHPVFCLLPFNMKLTRGIV